ncbi:MAG: hypothetical protein JWO58_433 [Chitinophagaceae bacterium]|nr:hypothetical protein [Chitinophagaceae bacterium]
MKQLIAALLLLGLAFQVQAQQDDSNFQHTNKGSHLAGGTISLASSFAASYNVFGANLNPNYGYFFADRMAVGGILSLNYSKSNTADASTLATLSPFFRYYFGPNKPLMFFGYASAGGGIYTYNQSNDWLYSFQVGPGVDYFINEHVALEGLVTYKGSQVTTTRQDYTNTVGLLVGLQIFF